MLAVIIITRFSILCRPFIPIILRLIRKRVSILVEVVVGGVHSKTIWVSLQREWGNWTQALWSRYLLSGHDRLHGRRLGICCAMRQMAVHGGSQSIEGTLSRAARIIMGKEGHFVRP